MKYQVFRIHVFLSVLLVLSWQLEICILTSECHLTHLRRWKLNLCSYLFKMPSTPPKHPLYSKGLCWNTIKRCQKSLLELLLECQINKTWHEKFKNIEYKVSKERQKKNLKYNEKEDAKQLRNSCWICL